MPRPAAHASTNPHDRTTEDLMQPALARCRRNRGQGKQWSWQQKWQGRLFDLAVRRRRSLAVRHGSAPAVGLGLALAVGGGARPGPGLVALQEVVQRLAGLLAKALARHPEVLDAVEAEGAEVVAQLAPSRQEPHRAEIGETQRPYGALGGLGLRVGVAEV